MTQLKAFNYFGWSVDDNDPLYKDLKIKKRNMATEEALLYKKISENFIIKKRVALHIGSHYGFKSKILSEIFNEVYTFDFDNLINKYMKMNINNFNIKNITVHSFGLGNENKNVDNSDYLKEKKIHGPLSNHIIENPKGRYKIKRLDDLKINNVDLMIIDTEGYELNVLKGGIKTIKKFLPVIIMEIHKSKDLTSRYGYNKVESFNFLKSLGYIAKGYINDEDILFIKNK